MDASDAILALYCVLPVAALTTFVLCWRRARSTKRSGWLVAAGNVSLLVALLSVALLGGEIYYRFLVDSTDGFDLDLVTNRWLQRHYRFNNFDVRDDVDYADRIAPDRLRVTVLGDSYSNGHGLEDVSQRFVNVLRRRHPDWEIHLIGGDGWDTDRLGAGLDRWLARGYQLDRVVYVYCLNDISDLIERWQVAAQRLYSEQPGFFFSHSYVLNTWYYRLKASLDPDLSSYFDFIAEAYRGPEWI